MKHSKKEIKLQIGGDKENTLSPQQKLFNNLTKKIETLTKKIEKDKSILDNCLHEYSKHLPHLQKEQAKAQFEMAKTLAESEKHIKYNQKQYQDLVNCIVWLCNDAFSGMEATEEMKTFYNKWSANTYEEELEEETNSIKEALRDEVKMNFGIDLDLSDLDDSPESMAKLQQRLMEAMQEKMANENNATPPPKKKKSKKQLEKEANEKEEEESKLKSIRSIYVALAKVLHPDTVMDEEDKLKREELMKKVTVAYNNKDIATLLRLELEWVANETNNLESLSEDKLKVYIATLKQQVSELEMENAQLYHHPRFHVISEFLRYNANGALQRIKRKEMELKNYLDVVKDRIKGIRKNYDKPTILKVINEVKESVGEDDILEEFFRMFG